MDLHFVLLAVLLGLFYSAAEEGNIRSRNAAKTYCGRHLSQTLSTVCQGMYNTLNKNQDIYGGNSNFHAFQPQYTSDYQRTVEYPYRDKASASSLMSNYKRKRRGVFNECCEKPCSREELSSYCAGGGKR